MQGEGLNKRGLCGVVNGGRTEPHHDVAGTSGDGDAFAAATPRCAVTTVVVVVVVCGGIRGDGGGGLLRRRGLLESRLHPQPGLFYFTTRASLIDQFV